MYETILAAWLFSAMTAWVPIARTGTETAEQATKRYEVLAHSIATHALMSDPLFDGDGGHERTALLEASIASFESSFDSRIAVGLSVIPGDNDGGKAVGYFQLHPNRGYFPYSRAELAASVDRQVEAASIMIHESWRVCEKQPIPFKLGWYASGGNGCARSTKGEARVKRAEKWWAEHALILPPDVE